MENESDKWFENGEKAYEKGLYGRALKWFSKAAEQGDDRALKRLGDMYYYGYGVVPKKKKAISLVQQAADQEYVDYLKRCVNWRLNH